MSGSAALDHLSAATLASPAPDNPRAPDASPAFAAPRASVRSVTSDASSDSLRAAKNRSPSTARVSDSAEAKRVCLFELTLADNALPYKIAQLEIRLAFYHARCIARGVDMNRRLLHECGIVDGQQWPDFARDRRDLPIQAKEVWQHCTYVRHFYDLGLVQYYSVHVPGSLELTERLEQFEKRSERRFEQLERRSEQHFQELVRRSEQHFQELERRSEQRFEQLERRSEQHFQELKQRLDRDDRVRNIPPTPKEPAGRWCCG